jgi:hypothetical protein
MPPTVENAFRPLTDGEREILVRLLGVPFPGRDDLFFRGDSKARKIPLDPASIEPIVLSADE